MELKVLKHELIRGLSRGIDIAEKRYESHAQHVAYIAITVGKILGFGNEELELVYYSSLLHDIGAAESYDLKGHSTIGAKMVDKLPVDKRMSQIILYHHEFIDGTGPFKKKNDEIPLISQIIHLANLFDYEYSESDMEIVSIMIKAKRWLGDYNRKFSDIVIGAFEKFVESQELIVGYYSSDFYERLDHLFAPQNHEYGSADVFRFAQVFSEMIDNRSKFTHVHSTGLTELVDSMTRRLGYSKTDQEKMHIAALLHDIGKLGVDNSIIDKPGKLLPEERAIMEKHAFYTSRILGSIKGFEDISKWAGNHHEKMNGTGYPRGMTASELSEQERLMAICDIYQALTEERPYRNPMSKDKAWSIINDMVRKGELDNDLVAELSKEVA